MISCYATPGKVKAVRLCELFAQGVNAAGGSARLSPGVPQKLAPGAAAFYGVTPETRHLWRQAVREQRDWFYIDNSYFDTTRGTSYRITRNAVQFKGIAPSDGARRAALGLTVQPMRDDGDHVVVCLQSPTFMQTVAGVDPRSWFDQIRVEVAERGLMTRLRGWNGNKAVQAQTLAADLENAALLITWSSAAAVEALMAGVPVRVSEQSAAHGIAPEQRDAWLNTLADNQWTLREIGDGTAWRMLNGESCKKAG